VNSGSDDIVWMGSGGAEQRLLMSSSAGLGFLCKLGDLASKTRQGKDFMKVDEGARANAAIYIPEGSTYLAVLSSDARLLLFPLDEVPERPNGGVGVQLIALPEKETLASVVASDGTSLVVSGVRRKNRTAETLDEKQLAVHVGKRAQRGRLADVGFRIDRLGS
jgi:topoisomerase-4 subunit A